MDLFDFDQAAVPPFDMDEYSSLTGEINEQDAEDCYDSLFFDKSASLPIEKPISTTSQIVRLKLINNREVDAILQDGTGDYPMYRAREPCALCARNGMDCYLAKRGALVTGCTTCISLYRECSFTHDPLPRGYMNTFPGIAEDQQVHHGTITERKPMMASTSESRGRKTGARFPRDAVKILKQWLSEHNDHPYPNEREKDELKQLTGLKRSQIANWLANARRRGKVRPPSGPTSPMLGAIDIPSSQCNNKMADLDPLDRWKISPPENEAASLTAIARALTNQPARPARQGSQTSLHNSRTSSRRASSEEDSTGFSMFRAPSVSSLGTRESSNSSLNSSRSLKSRASFASSQDRRRRRRAPIAQRAAAPINKTRTARIFQCTFCTDSFPAKYDWQRHEKSLHLALERWICCPNGGTRIEALTGEPQCVFCPEMNPSADHLETHNFMSCQEKTMQEKTFYRKDHLRQHLKLIHGSKFDPHMEAWKSTTTEIKSACGFCPSRFNTWQQRADHLAAHFKNGADMSGWTGNWGFEPHVEKLVENAIPPYLIGQERQTVVPYVARAAHQQPSPTTGTDGGLTFGTSCDGSSARVEPDEMTRDSNCWGRLEDELIKFVMEKKAQNMVPSDKELQDQGRMIVYGDTDPLDWTAADNQFWLNAFKFEHGIGPAPTDPQLQETRTVPLMPPYVIKGGLKCKRSSDLGCPQAAVQNLCGSVPPPSLPNSIPTNSVQSDGFNLGVSQPLSQEMDLDFDSIDFSGLDLNNFGEMQFEGVEDAAFVTSAMDFGPQYVPVQPDGMLNFGLPDMGTSTAAAAGGVPKVLQTGLENEPEMSLEAFDQLTGYMGSFR